MAALKVGSKLPKGNLFVAGFCPIDYTLTWHQTAPIRLENLP